MRPLFGRDLAGNDHAHELKPLGPLLLHDHKHIHELERHPEHEYETDDHILPDISEVALCESAHGHGAPWVMLWQSSYWRVACAHRPVLRDKAVSDDFNIVAWNLTCPVPLLPNPRAEYPVRAH